jgi:hypothetical protein
MKSIIFFSLCSLLCFAFAACATPEAAVAAGAIAASAVGIVNAISPLLEPEQLAKLHATASAIDGTVNATQTAIGLIADAFSSMKANVGAELAKHAANLVDATHSIAALPSREEVHLTNAGYGSGAVAVSRGLSVVKHARSAARAVAAAK